MGVYTQIETVTALNILYFVVQNIYIYIYIYQILIYFSLLFIKWRDVRKFCFIPFPRADNFILMWVLQLLTGNVENLKMEFRGGYEKRTKESSLFLTAACDLYFTPYHRSKSSRRQCPLTLPLLSEKMLKINDLLHSRHVLSAKF
jgi:hypothetical protein